METVVAGILGASATLIAAVIGYIATTRQKGKTKELGEQIQKTAAEWRSNYLGQFGYKTKRIESTAQIVDYEGTCQFVIEWHDLKVTRSDITFNSVPGHEVWVESPQGRILNKPTCSTIGSFPKAVSIVYGPQTEKTCKYNFEITGSLSALDPPLSYTNGLIIRCSQF